MCLPFFYQVVGKIPEHSANYLMINCHLVSIHDFNQRIIAV